MDRKNLLKRLATLLLFIFLVNYIAMKFYWYSAIWYFDMPMHFIGGFWLGLAYIWLFSVKEFSFKFIYRIILSILLIGIFWEVFELLVDKSITHKPFNALDTLSDIFFALAGGLSAVFYFFKKIMPINENTIQLK